MPIQSGRPLRPCGFCGEPSWAGRADLDDNFLRATRLKAHSVEQQQTAYIKIWSSGCTCLRITFFIASNPVLTAGFHFQSRTQFRNVQIKKLP